MEASEPILIYRRWLPYWAVLQTDLRQTLRSWVYLLWVIVSVLAMGGYLLYRFGLHNEMGAEQKASIQTTDLFRWLIMGSLSLIVILTVSSISSERGTLADSVLSRGISRYQYFLAKLHSRCFVVLGTMTILCSIVFFCSYLLFKDDLSIEGGFKAILAICAVMLGIVSIGVTIGALTQSTVFGITVLWISLMALGILLKELPEAYLSPIKSLKQLESTLKGIGSIQIFQELFITSAIVTAVSTLLGMIVFSRKDV
ncbi:ABC transporter permease [Telmatocola sphagniphila]|uniref:ABC transporter permease n=1 Tax=Telmatocola sphagniphila TaxID=1123043 RepID=A0A8E6B786_9BACT|nr:ABC transporter permease [Telmatocola sphagniphila]QVL32436.1 ABC transporter permease [Telmatocola sphagniphila]